MTAPSSSPAGRPKRRLPQFSLRTLLLVMLCFSVWFAIRGNAARRQRRAVAAVLAAGGEVKYDFQQVDWNAFNPNTASPGPAWLRRFLGPEFFQEVVSVSFRDRGVTDEDIEKLLVFSELEFLDLTNTRITGAALRHVARLRNLRTLILSKTTISSADLMPIAELKQLRQLYLWETAVDDAGLKHMEGLTQLETLNLDGTRVTDAGLKSLVGLTNMDEWLGLTDTAVSDAGLVHLKGMKKLKNLNLRRTNVTDQGANDLKRSLPKANISFGPDPGQMR